MTIVAVGRFLQQGHCSNSGQGQSIYIYAVVFCGFIRVYGGKETWCSRVKGEDVPIGVVMSVVVAGESVDPI